MKRMIVAAVVMAGLLAPASALAKKTTYIVTNGRLNYVKLVEIKPSEAEDRSMTHPVDIPEQTMRDILASLKLSKGHLFSDEADTREVFDERAISYLAPALSRAFREAKENEEVQFSFVVKDPFFVIRNDRLTMVTAWVSGNELYLNYKKLFAKLTGDTDKRGNLSKVVSRAKGVRVSMELGPGQTMAAVGSDTMVVDLKHDFTPVATATTGTAASTGKEKTTVSKHTKKSKYSRREVGEVTSAETPEATAAPAEKSVTQRLEELETLRERKLISRKEYNEKKKEILGDL